MAFKISDMVDRPVNKMVDLLKRVILYLRSAKEVKTKKGNEIVSKNWHSPY